MKIKEVDIGVPGVPGVSVKIDCTDSANQKAAWELYIEISTRVSTVKLADEADEKKALESIYKLFEETRETLKKMGKDAIQVARLAILILNKVIRPFTTKWHGKITKRNCKDFREELEELRGYLINYKKELANIAEIEDFID